MFSADPGTGIPVASDVATPGSFLQTLSDVHVG